MHCTYELDSSSSLQAQDHLAGIYDMPRLSSLCLLKINVREFSLHGQLHLLQIGCVGARDYVTALQGSTAPKSMLA